MLILFRAWRNAGLVLQHQLVVAAALRQQLLVRALLHHLALLYEYNACRIQYCRQPIE